MRGYVNVILTQILLILEGSSRKYIFDMNSNLILNSLCNFKSRIFIKYSKRPPNENVRVIS